MRQYLAILLICSVALSQAAVDPNAISDAKEFGRGFFGTFGADIDDCLGDDELANIAGKIDEIKHDWDSGSLIQKVVATAEDVYSFSNMLRGQGQLCHVTQIETMMKGFIAVVKEKGFMDIMDGIMEDHIMDLMTDIQGIANGISEKQYRIVGSSFANLWQVMFDSVQPDPSYTPLLGSRMFFDATTSDEATDFAKGFFTSFGADIAQCLDDADMENISAGIDSIKTASHEDGIKKVIGIVEAAYNLVQLVRQELKDCKVSTVEDEIKSFFAAIKTNGAKNVLLEVALQHGLDLLTDVKEIVSGVKSHDFQLTGQATGSVLNDFFSVATPTIVEVAAEEDNAALDNARDFVQGFFTNFGATVDTCIDDVAISSLQAALDQIKAAGSDHGIVTKIEDVIAGIMSLANVLKGEAHDCQVDSLETTIDNFVSAVKSEGIEKVALNAVLHHGLSLIADGKELYDSIKNKDYKEMGMATGAVLADITDESIVELDYSIMTVSTTVEDAKNFAQGFFSTFGADVTQCLDDDDFNGIVSDIDAIKSAFASKKIIQIITAGTAMISDVKDQSSKCEVSAVPALFKTFSAALKEDGIEKILVNALAINLQGLIADGKNLITGFSGKDFAAIGSGIGGLMNHIMGSDTPYFMPVVMAAEPNAAASEAKDFIQGFFNSWGADVAHCLEDAYVQKVADLIASVKDVWSNGSIVEKIETTVESAYAMWGLAQQEVTACKITALEDSIANFSAAIKAQGWQTILVAAAEKHALDLLTDGKEIMSAFKSADYKLVGQASGDLIKSLLDVPAPTLEMYLEVEAIGGAEDFARGFFNAFGADITQCLDDDDMSAVTGAIESIKSAWKGEGTFVTKIVTSAEALYSIYDTIKDQADQCQITKVESLVKDFVAAVKADSFKDVIMANCEAHVMDLIGDVTTLSSAIKSKDYKELGQVIGSLLQDVFGTTTSNLNFEKMLKGFLAY